MKKVLVYGTFNILHPGHLRFFHFAKSCGDYLIVAIQSNTTVQQQVYLDESARLDMVNNNIDVDEAFVSDETLSEIVDRLKPDILVKGKEYEHENNPEKDILKKYGGELAFHSGDVSFSSIDILYQELKSSLPNLNLPVDYMNRHKINRHQVQKYLDDFSKLNILVIGDLIMDEYVFCEPLGMSQEDPTIVVKPIERELFIGGAGIVALHASSLGATVKFVSIVGNDEMKDRVQSEFDGSNINTDFIVDKHRPTTLKKRYRCKDQTLFRVSNLSQDDIDIDLQREMLEKVEKVMDEMDLVVFSDFNYGCLPSYVVNKVTQLAQESKVYIAADSQSSSQVGDISRYRLAGLLTPTEHEARIALRDNTSGLVVLAEKLRERTNATNILLKLGREGVLVQADHNNSDFLTDKIEAINQSVKDVSGAGDSMLITSAMTLCLGGSIWIASLIGSISAAIQVSRIGNIPLKIDELKQVINK